MPTIKLQRKYERGYSYYYEFDTEADSLGEGGMGRIYLGKNGAITRAGCHPIEYPFPMVFIKPNPQARDKKTTVTITAVRKKEKEIILPI